MSTLAAGKLRHRIRILEQTESRDTSGGISEKWKPIETRWAHVEQLRGSERVAGDAVEATLTHSVTMRRRRGLTTAHRIEYLGREFDIDSVTEDETRTVMTVLCAAVVS